MEPKPYSGHSPWLDVGVAVTSGDDQDHPAAEGTMVLVLSAVVPLAFLKRPLIREDLKVIQYQSQEADNTFITSDGTSPYNSTRKWAVKCHYREDNN